MIQRAMRSALQCFLLLSAGVLATPCWSQSGPPVFSVGIEPEVAQLAHRTAERKSDAKVDGRVYVIVTRNADKEPRLQGVGQTQNASPFWGKDVDGLTPGKIVELSAADTNVYGYPLPSLKDLPPGRYYVQAFMNVYETFHRSDGSIVKLHMPCGDGHRIMWSTGNIYSDVQEVEIGRGAVVQMTLKHVIEPFEAVPKGGTCQQGNPPVTEHVKLMKVRSSSLSKFWGRPIYLAAKVVLPRSYKENSKKAYPVVFLMDHHPRAYLYDGNYPGALYPLDENGKYSGSFYAFDESGTDPLSKWWLSTDAPEAILVIPLSENPYYDTSFWINSANSGPYGGALVEEFIPAIQRRFRIIDNSWARTVTGCSAAGWIAAAAQVFNPDVFGGAFVFSPDIVDFRAFYTLDLYKDDNAYYHQTEWRRWPRLFIRDRDGDIQSTVEDWANLERALGNHGRSGEYFDHLDATWGPVGPDGYPLSRWNRTTGEINRDVVAEVSRWDISRHLEANWRHLQPKLRGKLQFFTPETDDYFLNLAVQRLQERLAKLNPASDAEFTYFPGTHCTTPLTQINLITKMVDFMEQNRPK